METYKDLLQSPKWQKKRLEVFDQKGFKCEQCGEKEEQLAIHHKYYKKNHKPWEYEDDVYMVLCKSCHKEVHDLKKYNLSLDEARIIELIREKLNENEIKSLEKLLIAHNDSEEYFFIHYLPELMKTRILKEFVIAHIGLYKEHSKLFKIVHPDIELRDNFFIDLENQNF